MAGGRRSSPPGRWPEPPSGPIGTTMPAGAASYRLSSTPPSAPDPAAISFWMFSATIAACRAAAPATFRSAVDTSPSANTRSWPATCRVGETSISPSGPRAPARPPAR